MTPDEQEARSLKWEPRRSVTIRQLSSGTFAMYHIGGVGSPFWIGPGEDILTAYAQRPAPSPRTALPQRPALPPKVAGVTFNI